MIAESCSHMIQHVPTQQCCQLVHKYKLWNSLLHTFHSPVNPKIHTWRFTNLQEACCKIQLIMFTVCMCMLPLHLYKLVLWINGQTWQDLNLIMASFHFFSKHSLTYVYITSFYATYTLLHDESFLRNASTTLHERKCKQQQKQWWWPCYAKVKYNCNFIMYKKHYLLSVKGKISYCFSLYYV